MKKFILCAALVAAAVFVSGYSTTQLTVVTRTHTVISGVIHSGISPGDICRSRTVLVTYTS